MVRLGRYVLAPLAGLLLAGATYAQEMTDVGTPRNETLIVQTFDGKSANPDVQNPLNQYAIWRGFRELGWSFLWEMDTATGQSYPELAAGPVEVLNPEHTKFRVKIRPGVFWSDGVEFTVDDLIYTLDTSFKYKDKLTFVARTTNYVKRAAGPRSTTTPWTSRRSAPPTISRRCWASIPGARCSCRCPSTSSKRRATMSSPSRTPMR
jgi:peptide/nickel transport system substrate-binding protein